VRSPRYLISSSLSVASVGLSACFSQDPTYPHPFPTPSISRRPRTNWMTTTSCSSGDNFRFPPPSSLTCSSSLSNSPSSSLRNPHHFPRLPPPLPSSSSPLLLPPSLSPPPSSSHITLHSPSPSSSPLAFPRPFLLSFPLPPLLLQIFISAHVNKGSFLLFHLIAAHGIAARP